MITPEERAELTREITEHILLLLPGVIAHLINNISTMKELSTKFYVDNKDLVPHKQTVSMVIQQLEAEFPGKSIPEILEMASNKARSVLSQQRSVNSMRTINATQLDKVLGEL